MSVSSARPSFRAKLRRALTVAALSGGGAACLAASMSACSVADSAPRMHPQWTAQTAEDRIAARAEVTYMAECDPDSRVKRPSSFVLSCADGNEVLEGLTWRGWGENEAVGAGEVVTNGCSPSCAEGKDISFPVRVVADQLVEDEAAATYRRLTVTVEGQGAGEANQQVYHLPGVGPGVEVSPTG